MSKQDDAIVERIMVGMGIPDLLDRLTALPGKDFQSLLLRVIAERVKERPLSEIVRAAGREEFFGPSSLDQRELHRFDGFFFRVIPESFAAVELSPVNPLGLNAALTRVSQNNVLSSLRGMEVVADPTTALSLEASRRRKKLFDANPRDSTPVDLCTCQRVLRLQPFDKALGYLQHFDVFALCTAGRAMAGTEAFTIQHALRHIRIHLDLVRVLNREGFDCRDMTVYISDIRLMEQLVQRASVDRPALMRSVLDPAFKPFDFLKVALPSKCGSAAALADELKTQELGEQATFFSVLENELLMPLRQEYPEVQLGFDLARMAGLGYYKDFCFHLYAKNKDGREIQLSDGGTSDWTQRLLVNGKERLLTSGFGAELVHNSFRR